MNHVNLKLQFSCATCMFLEPDLEDETKGTCHAGPPEKDEWGEVTIATGWCAEHQLASVEEPVPNVVGMLLPEAAAVIQAIHPIQLGSIARVAGSPVNTVMAQSPIAGTPVVAGLRIDLIITNETI